MESLIFEHQAENYQALQKSTRQTDAAPFVTFMLRMILDTVTTSTPEVAPGVRLLSAFAGEMNRQQIKTALGLKDDEHFHKAYLLPALEAGLIEMTIPDKPRSSRQKYRLTDKGRERLTQHGQWQLTTNSRQDLGQTHDNACDTNARPAFPSLVQWPVSN